MHAPRILLLPALLAASACGKEPAMQFATTAFADGAAIPAACTGDGADRSPALSWSGAPSGTRAFAILVDDPDAPVGLWTHWVLYDLGGDSVGLDAGQARTPALPGGARQGSNSWGNLGWNGPAPPPGKPHRYFFRIYALAAPLGLEPGATAAQVQTAMKGRILAEGKFMGTYRR